MTNRFTLPLLVATRSQGKLKELLPLLSTHGLQGQSLTDAGIEESDAEAGLEVFDSFEDNALAKARWFASLAPGRIVLADDSGLMVDALNGAPGVRSKRWSGRPDLEGAALDVENNRTLLRALADAASAGDARRGASYRCAAAACADGVELVALGSTHGVILERPRGHGGFGYDPYFHSIELGRTFAEVTREEKAAVSHRARAFCDLLRMLVAHGAIDPDESRTGR